MEIFIGRLRKVLNHLTRERHVDFHKKIAEAAERRFKSVDDYLIQDWIDTETLILNFLSVVRNRKMQDAMPTELF